MRLFEQLGVDIAGVLPFDEVRSMEAERFVEGVLVRALGARLVAVGTDFRFGHDRRGDAGLLMRMGERFGFELDEVPLLAEGDGPCRPAGFGRWSAPRRGRRLRGSGAALRPQRRRGARRRSGTLHWDPHRQPGDGRAAGAPGTGVYAAIADHRGTTYKAAVNVGVRPTFGGDRLIVEAHLLDAPPI